MYEAVYFFGPAWPDAGSKGLVLSVQPRPVAMTDDMEVLTRLVEEQQLVTMDEIETWRPPDVAGRKTQLFGRPAQRTQ